MDDVIAVAMGEIIAVAMEDVITVAMDDIITVAMDNSTTASFKLQSNEKLGGFMGDGARLKVGDSLEAYGLSPFALVSPNTLL